jgi:serine/threonine-protein kinase
MSGPPPVAPVTSPRIRKHAVERTTALGLLTLPPELLAEASRRLGWLGLIYSGAYALAYFGARIAISLGGAPYDWSGVQDLFAVGSVAMGLAVFFLARRNMLSPQRLLDVGLGFEVAGAFGIAINEFWFGLPGDAVTRRYLGIPWECVWMIVYPLVAPNTPRKILFASLLAASMGPVSLVVAGRAAGVDYFDPPMRIATYFLFSSYLCALLAYVVARIVHRYAVRLKHAREIGSYELVRKLGEGGMGEVWKARHRLLARPAAVKLIRADLLGPNQKTREAAVRRFEREAQETAALGSTHTVDIYDFGVAEDGSFYYVMELLDGLSLERLVRRFGPVPPARLVYLLRQVCHSLGEAHARGLIHRDIKPANIFLCRLGPDYDFIKVLDFGLVKHVEGLSTATLLTAQGIAAGTPAYMPPEVALGRADVDARADLYAVGCVAYWLLTGQSVFAGDTPVATILAHVRNEPEPPSARTELWIPPALDRLVMECLSKDAAARPASAGELARRLAVAVPDDPWTSEKAREWWDLHHVATPIAEPEDESVTAAATLVPEGVR